MMKNEDSIKHSGVIIKWNHILHNVNPSRRKKRRNNGQNLTKSEKGSGHTNSRYQKLRWKNLKGFAMRDVAEENQERPTTLSKFDQSAGSGQNDPTLPLCP